MRCFICDKSLNEINFNRDHEDIDPCPECILVIQDTVAGFHDRTSVAEDELGEDLPLTGFEPEDFEPEFL